MKSISSKIIQKMIVHFMPTLGLIIVIVGAIAGVMWDVGVGHFLMLFGTIWFLGNLILISLNSLHTKINYIERGGKKNNPVVDLFEQFIDDRP